VFSTPVTGCRRCGSPRARHCAAHPHREPTDDCRESGGFKFGALTLGGGQADVDDVGRADARAACDADAGTGRSKKSASSGDQWSLARWNPPSPLHATESQR